MFPCKTFHKLNKTDNSLNCQKDFIKEALCNLKTSYST